LYLREKTAASIFREDQEVSWTALKMEAVSSFEKVVSEETIIFMRKISCENLKSLEKQ
jgi:hypothetical protein